MTLLTLSYMTSSLLISGDLSNGKLMLVRVILAEGQIGYVL